MLLPSWPLLSCIPGYLFPSYVGLKHMAPKHRVTIMVAMTLLTLAPLLPMSFTYFLYREKIQLALQVL